MEKKIARSVADYTLPLRLKDATIIKPYPHETWKEYTFEVEEWATKKRRYAFSDYGRFGSFYKSINEDLVAMNTHLVLGYIVARMWYMGTHPETGKRVRLYKAVSLHKAMAELFIPKTSPDQEYVIHLDYDKVNNDFSNLAWATKAEYLAHIVKNPARLAKTAKVTGRGFKLTAGQVKTIKRLLAEKKTRYRTIAQRFGVSTTMIEDIKKGKKWAHVTLD